MSSSDLVMKADVFAASAHAAVGQFRKYTSEPYIVHPRAVKDLVQSVPHTDDMLIAALLHDVVEDTEVPLVLIDQMFGRIVSQYVMDLTNVDQTMGNRAFRHQLNLHRLADASAAVQTIKMADIIDNVQSIVEHDPKFAVLYVKEKKDVALALSRADNQLRERAMHIIAQSEFKLGLK